MFALRFSGICVTVAKGTRFGHLLFFLKEVSLLKLLCAQMFSVFFSFSSFWVWCKQSFFFTCLLTGFPLPVYFCMDWLLEPKLNCSGGGGEVVALPFAIRFPQMM